MARSTYTHSPAHKAPSRAPMGHHRDTAFRSARTERNRKAASGGSRLPALPSAAGRTSARQAVVPARPESESSSFKAALGGSLFALPISLILGLIFLLIAAGVASAMQDPDRFLTPLGLAVRGLTALCGGFIAARRAERAPLLCGLLFGGIIVIALFLGALCFGDTSRTMLTLGLSAAGRAGLYALTVAAATGGALIGRGR